MLGSVAQRVREAGPPPGSWMWICGRKEEEEEERRGRRVRRWGGGGVEVERRIGRRNKKPFSRLSLLLYLHSRSFVVPFDYSERIFEDR